MDGQVQPVIAPILHFELAERHIAHSYVKEIIGEIHLFIAQHRNAATGVELAGNTA